MSRKSVHPRTAIIVLFSIVYVVLFLVFFSFDAVPENSDTPSYINIASKYSVTNPRLFSDGLHPGGYPALLRILVRGTGLQFITAGKLLSAVSGFACLLLVMIVAERVSGTLAAGTAGCLLLGNKVFLSVSAAEGTDSIAAAFQVLALCLAVGRPVTYALSTCRAGILGLCLGAGYLFRFSVLAIVPVFCLYVVATVQDRRKRSIFLFLLGFALGAFPQLYSSAIVTGNPLHNEQAKNAWFGMHGERDWSRRWSKIPDEVSLWGVVSSDPPGFLHHWFDELRLFFSSNTGWVEPTGLATLCAAASAVFVGSVNLRIRLLLVLFALAPVAVTAIAFVTDRHGIVSIIGLSIVTGVVLADALKGVQRSSDRIGHWVLVVMSGLIMIVAVTSWREFPNRPSIRSATKIHSLVRSLGINEPGRVATNLPLVDFDAKWPLLYSRFDGIHGTSSVEELLNVRADAADWQFMVIDYHEAWGDFLPLKEEIESGGSALVPLHLRDSFGIYMIRPVGIGDAIAERITFPSGIELLGHTWVWTSDQIAVYLFWSAEKKTEVPFLTEARLVDSLGNVFSSHRGTPELETYPTTIWSPGDVIVDLHILVIEDATHREGALEICLLCAEKSFFPERECHVIDGLFEGGRTPFP